MSIQNILCSTEDEYINKLSLSNNEWWDDNKECHWIFRGQKSSLKLIPSLFRLANVDLNRFEYLKDVNEVSSYGWSDLTPFIENTIQSKWSNLNDLQSERIRKLVIAAFHEINKTEKFLLRCNQVLLQTPTLKLFQDQNQYSAFEYFVFNLEQYIDKFNQSMTEKERCGHVVEYPGLYNIEFPEAMALARHHSIASRLLDWSEDPLIAAFFSVINSSTKDSICVWALNTRHLRLERSYGQIAFYKRLSRTGLEFLHLQKGLFTNMLGLDGYFYEQGVWPSLDQYLLKTFTDSAGISYPQNEYLRKIEIKLNSEKRKNLIKRLDKMHINKYTLMPTYDNVGDSI